MNKEQEALKELYINSHFTDESKRDRYYDLIQQALLELKAIKEAKPSEAVENIIQALNHTLEVSNKARLVLNEEPVSVNWNEVSEIKIIKQALIKGQEQEKALKLITSDKCDFIPLNKFKNWTYDLYVRWFDLNHYDVKYLLAQEEFDLIKRRVEKCLKRK